MHQYSQNPAAVAKRKRLDKRREERFGVPIEIDEAMQRITINRSRYIRFREFTKYSPSGCRCEYSVCEGAVVVDGINRSITRSVKLYGRRRAYLRCAGFLLFWLPKAYPPELVEIKMKSIIDNAPKR